MTNHLLKLLYTSLILICSSSARTSTGQMKHDRTLRRLCWLKPSTLWWWASLQVISANANYSVMKLTLLIVFISTSLTNTHINITGCQIVWKCEQLSSHLNCPPALYGINNDYSSFLISLFLLFFFTECTHRCKTRCNDSRNPFGRKWYECHRLLS